MMIDTSTIVDLQPTALVFLTDDVIPYDVLNAIGDRLQSGYGSINWWLGDWLNRIERDHGELYTQAIDVTGMGIGRLQNCKYVASRVQTSCAMRFCHGLTTTKSPAWTPRIRRDGEIAIFRETSPKTAHPFRGASAVQRFVHYWTNLFE